MMNETEIRELIRKTEDDYKHVLSGTLATIQINAPRALMQVVAESRLVALHEVLGEWYVLKLKGVD